MQTFLPYPSFVQSAEVLDRQRLGKQRVEAYQILNVLQGAESGWRNHPAVEMWRGYPAALALYHDTIVMEWVKRGYRNNMKLQFYSRYRPLMMPKSPEWLGDPAFHLSHRSNLLRKAPDHYRQFWPEDPDDLPYVWPGRG